MIKKAVLSFVHGKVLVIVFVFANSFKKIGAEKNGHRSEGKKSASKGF